MRSFLLAAVLLATAAQAHFKVMSPTPVYQQSAMYGDPQKAPPCGADGTQTATGAVHTYTAGDTVDITIDETVTHPGHYRVALGETGPMSLPAEPAVQPGTLFACGTADIQSPAVYPVLADNVLPHTSAFGGPQTMHVTLPANKTCTGCTLQIIEFMSDHGLNNPGGCYYHHCLTLDIVARDGGTMGTGGGSAAGGGAATGGGTAASGGGTAASGGGAAASGGGAGGTGGGAAGGGSSTGGGAGAGDATGGCACSEGGLASMGLLALLTLASTRRRK